MANEGTTNCQRYPNKSKNIQKNNIKYTIYIALIIFIIQIGTMIPVASVFRFQFNLYWTLAPFIAGLFILTSDRKIYFYSKSMKFILIYILLILSILIFQIHNMPFDELIKHLLALGVGFIAFSSVHNVRNSTIFSLILVAGIPVIVVDVFAHLGILPIRNTASVVFPGFSRGGIGVDALFGTHGIVVSLTIVSSIGVWKYTNNKYLQLVLILVISSGLFSLFASQSRSSVMAISVGIYIISFYHFSKNRLFVISSIIAAFLIICSFLWFVVLRPSTVISRLDQIYIALDLLIKNTIVGIGWGTFERIYGTHLHFTPLIYFTSNGIIVGLFYIFLTTYPILIGVRALSRLSKTQTWPIFVLLSSYIIILFELSMYNNVPSVHQIVIGGFLCALSVSTIK